MSETYATASSNFDVQHTSDLLGRVMREQTWSLRTLKEAAGIDPAVYAKINATCSELRGIAQDIEDLRSDHREEANRLAEKQHESVRARIRGLECLLADLRASVIVETTKPLPLWRRICRL